jgi:hypothetical protein
VQKLRTDRWDRPKKIDFKRHRPKIEKRCERLQGPIENLPKEGQGPGKKG